MNDQRAPIAIEDRGSAAFQSKRIGLCFEAPGTVLRYEHVRQVAGVRPIGALQAVFSAPWIEVPAGADKAGAFAFSDRMNVYCMQPRREALNFHAHQHTVRSFAKERSTDRFPILVLKLSGCPGLRRSQ